MHNAKCRHQSPEWMILSHVSCFIQGEVIGFQVLLDSLHPHSTRVSWWSPPVLLGKAVKILASVSSGICIVWPNRERRRAWTIAERCDCPVVHLTSSFHLSWYHLSPNSCHWHHWSRASILGTSFLATAQHSEPYRKMGRMQVLYSFGLPEM